MVVFHLQSRWHNPTRGGIFTQHETGHDFKIRLLWQHDRGCAGVTGLASETIPCSMRTTPFLAALMKNIDKQKGF